MVDSKFCRELPFDGGGALELVVDLHAQAPSSLLELGGDVGCPLCSVGSELPDLQQKSAGKRKHYGTKDFRHCLSSGAWRDAGLPKSCRCHWHKFLMPKAHSFIDSS